MPTVLHVHFQPPSAAADPRDAGGWLFWAEAADAQPAGLGGGGRDRIHKGPQPHPFAAPSDAAGRLIDDFSRAAGHEPPARRPRQTVLWLPTRGNRPRASLPWLDDAIEEGSAMSEPDTHRERGAHRDADEGRPRLRLVDWSIEGVWLALSDGCRVLLYTQDVDLGAGDAPAEVRLGDDWRYWQAAARWVNEGLAAQRVLPALLAAGDRGAMQARWLPVMDDARSAERLMRMADAMPGVCRAEAPAPAQAPAPRAHLESFLNLATDALARAAVLAHAAQTPDGSAAARAAGLAAPSRPSGLAAPSRPSGLAAPSRPSGLSVPSGASGLSVPSGASGAWLRALCSADPRVHATAAQLDHLREGYAAWLRNLFVSGDRATCVAFRLQEPPVTGGEGEPWRLHFLLQARDDPSLLVPAEAVWKSKGAALATLGRQFHHPGEVLLAGLGYAARLTPAIKRALAAKKPTSARLSTEEAYTFLREAAPVLQAAGFGVIVPTWWGRPEGRLGLRLALQARTAAPQPGHGSDGPGVAGGSLGMQQLVAFEWQVALGGEPLTRAELERLVALKRPLVEMRGQWVQLDPTQVEAAIRFWDRHPVRGTFDALTALAWGVGGEAQVAGLPVEDVEAAPEIAAWLDALTGAAPLAPVDVPAGLLAELRPYQRDGLAWLLHRYRHGMGGILADDMGLGKTVQMLACLLQLKSETGRLPGPVLLVCPTSVVTNWARESARFTPTLGVHVHQGPERLSGTAFADAARAADLVVTSFALVRRDAETIRGVGWHGVVVDEAQQIKNPDSQQARAVRQLGGRLRFALTGTPVENRLTELWSIMEFLAPGYLGTREAFRKRIAVPVERHNDAAALRRLRKLTAPFLLRRLKTDPAVIRDLPEKQEIKVYCALTREQVTLYEAAVRESLAAVEAADGIARRGLVLALLTRLKQVCNHPAQLLGQLHGAVLDAEAVARSGKLVRLVEILEEALDDGDRALIFTQYAEMGGALKRVLQSRLGVEALFLHGGVPPARRDDMVQRFQSEAGPPLFILSLKAGGTGLNLTRASHVVHFDRWWNPAVEDQATDRAFRIGQTQNVLVHKFVCTGTLEEKIDQLLDQKKALAESVVGAGGEQWLTELSNAELRELVRLRREALGE